jgi:hypothetical protein
MQDLSEYFVETETQLGQLIPCSSANIELQKSPASFKAVSDSSDEEDNRPIRETVRPKGNIIPFIKGIKMMSARESEAMVKDGDVDRWSSGSEGDDVPIIKANADKVELVIPEGELAVGAGIARLRERLGCVQRSDTSCAGSETKTHLSC